MRCLALVLLGLCPCLASAEDETALRLARLHASYEGWLSENGLDGVLAAKRQGVALAPLEKGWPADRPVELASLSKAITAICAAELVRTGRLTWDLRAHPELDISLEQLIAQSGGLSPDQTQITMPGWLDKPATDGAAQTLAGVLQRGGAHGSPGQYEYNNENYALAGAIIEEATGQPYAEICVEMALEPAGVTGQPSPRSGAFLPWGGWQMSAADFAAWHGYWFGQSAYAADLRATPHVEVEPGVFYGLGTFAREFPRGNSYWHFGALCFPGRLETGSYAVTVFSDCTVVAAYSGCLEWSDLRRLDALVIEAVFGELE